MVRFVAAACSDKGLRRRNNEDNFCLNGQYMQPDQRDAGGTFTCETDGRALFAVCDGMGGQEAGEEASYLSSEFCAKAVAGDPGVPSPFGSGNGAQRGDLLNFLREGCVRVLRQAQECENNSGSTIVMLLADPKGFIPANMGDSRLYRLTSTRMTQVSEDHTEVRRLLKIGAITAEEMKTHPRRHMILQYWGMPLGIAPFGPHVGEPIPYVDGEKYLLCSDGLTDMLEDAQIEAILRQDKPETEIAQDLVAAALKNGGRDNVTVIVVTVHGESETDETVRKGRRPGGRRRLWPWLAGFFLAVAAAAGGAAAFLWLRPLR